MKTYIKPIAKYHICYTESIALEIYSNPGEGQFVNDNTFEEEDSSKPKNVNVWED